MKQTLKSYILQPSIDRPPLNTTADLELPKDLASVLPSNELGETSTYLV